MPVLMVCVSEDMLSVLCEVAQRNQNQTGIGFR